MISRWKWMLKQTIKKLWFRATLFAIVAIITALLSILFKSMIPESVSVKVGAEAVDNILNILASSMLAVTTFSLSIMVTAYGSATTNVTPRATRLVVEDVTTQNVLATFIGSFLLKWSTKTGHRVRVFSSIDFPIRLGVTHRYIRAVLVRCNIQRYSPLWRELPR